MMMNATLLPKLNTYIESFFGSSSSQTSLEERLKKLKNLFTIMGLIENMDIDNSIIVTHDFTNLKVIDTLTKVLLDSLQFNGQTYDSKVSGNIIILKKQSPIIRIFIRMLENIKTEKVSFSDFNTYLMRMMELVKKVSSEEEIAKLGCKCGKIMIQIYEKEKNVNRWDVRKFIEYAQEASTILSQDTEWNIISQNVVHGRIITCPLARNNNTINCEFIKGIFDGWIYHVFGEKRTHNIHTPASEKDSFCETYIAF